MERVTNVQSLYLSKVSKVSHLTTKGHSATVAIARPAAWRLHCFEMACRSTKRGTACPVSQQSLSPTILSVPSVPSAPCAWEALGNSF